MRGGCNRPWQAPHWGASIAVTNKKTLTYSLFAIKNLLRTVDIASFGECKMLLKPGCPKLFVADDNLDFATFISTTAKRDGWEVATCANGGILIDKLLESHGPALLLIDINMPEMDGIEVIEELTELDRSFRLRFMTGGTIPSIIAAGMIAKARNLSVGQSIFKPLDLKTLKDILHIEREALTKMDTPSP
jgi:CheY-like chemotaxis protein